MNSTPDNVTEEILLVGENPSSEPPLDTVGQETKAGMVDRLGNALELSFLTMATTSQIAFTIFMVLVIF